MSNPRRYRRRRRNPRDTVGNLLSDYIVPAGIGAGSAVLLAVGWGYLAPSLPAQVQTGVGAALTQGALVIVAGTVLSSAMPRARSSIAAGAVGALTVIAYNAIADTLSGFGLGTGVAGLQDYRTYVRTGRPVGRMNAYMPGGQGRAMPIPAGRRNVSVPIQNRRMGRIGWVSPASPLAPRMGGFNAYMRYGQAPQF